MFKGLTIKVSKQNVRKTKKAFHLYISFSLGASTHRDAHMVVEDSADVINIANDLATLRSSWINQSNISSFVKNEALKEAITEDILIMINEDEEIRFENISDLSVIWVDVAGNEFPVQLDK